MQSMNQKEGTSNDNSNTSTAREVPEIVIGQYESDRKGIEQVIKLPEVKDEKMEAEDQLSKTKAFWPPEKTSR